MVILVLIYFLFSSAYASIDGEWLKKAGENIDYRAEEFYSNILKSKLKEIKPDRETERLVENEVEKRKCRFSENLAVDQKEASFLVAMSFDLSDALWKELSDDLEKIGGSFIVRGVPQGSFGELDKRIKRLSEIGVNARIDIDPVSFEKYSIESVPTFVSIDKGAFDKLTGMVSVGYALEKMSSDGETMSSKRLWSTLRGEM